MEAQRAVDGVTLGPIGTVEYHSGKQQENTEGGTGAVATRNGQTTHQPVASPGKQHVEEHGKEFDQVEIAHREIGDGGQKVEIGDVVVPLGQRHCRPAAVFPEEGGPAGEKVPIVVGHMLQAEGTEKKSKSDGKKGEQCGTGSPVLIKKKPCRQRTQQDKAQPHGKAGGGIAEAGGPAQGQKEEQEPRAAAERGRIRGKELGLQGMGAGHSVHLVVGKKEKSPDHSELRHKKT